MTTAEPEPEQVYEVIIVGLGPTGLTLASLLGRRGLRVLALEREPRFYGMARAVYTDDECMRIFQAAGAADELAARMNTDCTVQWLRHGSVFAQFMQPARPLGWPVVNFFYQPYLEGTLEALLGRYPNVRLWRGREVVSLSQSGDGVTVRHAHSTGTRYGVAAGATTSRGSDQSVAAARYVVACDGGRSTVRSQLGIAMAGSSFSQRWLVVDLKAKVGADPFRHLPYFDFHCDPELPTISCPLPGGHHRFEFLLGPEQTTEETPDPDTVRAYIGRHVDVEQVQVLRRLVYTFNALVADSWRQGPVLLAGDAAHMTPQFIGQGMSSGIRDAHNLAWKLTAVLRDGADDRILDSYQAERRPHAKAMIDMSLLMKRIVSVSEPRTARARDVTLRAALATPVLGGYIRQARMKPRPRFRRGAYLGMPRGRLGVGVQGELLPQPQVRTFEGRLRRLDDVLGEEFALLGYRVDPHRGMSERDLAVWRALRARFAVLYRLGGRPRGAPHTSPVDGDPVPAVEDLTGELVRWLHRAGIGPGTVIVLRPDKFVFGVVPAARIGAATDAVIAQLGLAEPGETVPGVSGPGPAGEVRRAGSRR